MAESTKGLPGGAMSVHPPGRLGGRVWLSAELGSLVPHVVCVFTTNSLLRRAGLSCVQVCVGIRPHAFVPVSLKER